MTRIEYYGDPHTQRTVELTHEVDGLFHAVFESGAEQYYDDHEAALDVLDALGYTDRISGIAG